MAKASAEVKLDKIPGGVTQAQIDMWKAQHGSVSLVQVPLNDQGTSLASAYVRKPNLTDLSAATAVQENDPMLAGQILFDNCYLGGDPEVSSIDEVKLSVIVALKSIFKVRVAAIKEV